MVINFCYQQSYYLAEITISTGVPNPLESKDGFGSGREDLTPVCSLLCNDSVGSSAFAARNSSNVLKHDTYPSTLYSQHLYPNPRPKSLHPRSLNPDTQTVDPEPSNPNPYMSYSLNSLKGVI